MTVSNINKLGTQIILPDGQEATVVYNSLVGVGVKFGLHDPDPKDFEGTCGNTFQENAPDEWPWEPDALLREPHMAEQLGMPCIGEDYEIVRVGLSRPAQADKERE